MNINISFNKRRVLRLSAFSFFISCILSFLIACGQQAKAVKLSGFTMGTSYHITIVDDLGEHKPLVLQSEINQWLADFNQSMSTWIADSDINQVNKLAAGVKTPISFPLLAVISDSVSISRLSEGAFDITIGPLIDLWGFNSNQENTVPTDASIQDAKKQVGYDAIELSVVGEQAYLIKKAPRQLNLSAIAKGKGVDGIAELLREKGFKNFLVEIGGELYLSGHNDKAKPWRIAIEQPDNSFGQVFNAIAVSDHAVATSGDYRNYFEKDGKRYSHTIDPVTGKPVEHNLASVTVVHPSAAVADGLATAINVMGAERGLALAANEELAIYVIIKTEQGFKAVASDAFKPFLAKQK